MEPANEQKPFLQVLPRRIRFRVAAVPWCKRRCKCRECPLGGLHSHDANASPLQGGVQSPDRRKIEPLPERNFASPPRPNRGWYSQDNRSPAVRTRAGEQVGNPVGRPSWFTRHTNSTDPLRRRTLAPRVHVFATIIRPPRTGTCGKTPEAATDYPDCQYPQSCPNLGRTSPQSGATKPRIGEAADAETLGGSTVRSVIGLHERPSPAVAERAQAAEHLNRVTEN